MGATALTFLWHQHQPYYPDDLTGENPMPWVRLHGVKDYYGMALHLLEVPEMRCTINLVPSLILQLLAYTERGATDHPLTVSRIPADGLAEADALFLLDNFFMANPDHMVRPFPRYAELHQRRAADRNQAREALRRFNEKDLRDLQVWFNLTWIHPLAVEQDATLSELVVKGRHFTEADKQYVLDAHLTILRQVLPLHKRLADRGQVELTTTPYYHPILPLLFDKKLAREAMPDVKLPRHTSSYAEDADIHVRRAVEQHTARFGTPPAGMWPSEGSVCQAMLPLLAQNGIRWIATDEEILNRSTHGFVSRDAKGHVRNPERMYCSYKVAEAGHELGIIFRDHALSDMIGFHYQRSEPQAAADDFVHHLQAIGNAVHRGPEPALVPVILDGENCWEHYPGGGVAFLRALYQRCTRTPGIEPMTVSECLERYPPHDTLPHLFAGSWISHNFAIWIGHEEDNTAWDALHRAREHLKHRAAELRAVGASADREERLHRPWEEIYIAEGSDWFWWYGDDHSSAQDALFDQLFRKHLQNVYLLLGDVPPADLSRAISRSGHRVIHTMPRAFLNVRIDGRQTFFEWVNAGRYTCQSERGTMAMVTRGLFKEVYFGFNLDALLLRVDCETQAASALAGFEVRLGFVEPPGHEVRITPARGDTPTRWELRHLDTVIEAEDVDACIDHILEVSVPFARLGVVVGGPIQFFVELWEGDQSRERAPREGVITLSRPSTDFEQIMWEV